jgi:alkylation response protein AidB-like acyl-CoA dehydrogenase
VDLQETAEQTALRKELSAYVTTLMTDEERRQLAIAQVGGPRFRELTKRMGNDGWLGVGWPVEYGGQGRPIEDQYVFFDELMRTGLPFPFVTINTVGPTLMAAGTPEQ